MHVPFNLKTQLQIQIMTELDGTPIKQYTELGKASCSSDSTSDGEPNNRSQFLEKRVAYTDSDGKMNAMVLPLSSHIKLLIKSVKVLNIEAPLIRVKRTCHKPNLHPQRDVPTAAHISLSALVYGLHFTKVRNLSDKKSSCPIIFEIELWAHWNESTAFARRSQILVEPILDWHHIF